MNRSNKLFVSGIGICVSIFLAYLVFSFNDDRKSKGSVDVLEQLKFPPYLSFDCPITTGLYQTIYKREPSLLRDPSGNLIKLSTAFQKLQEDGKATTEEVKVVIEFEKARDYFDNATGKVCDISSLYCDIGPVLLD